MENKTWTPVILAFLFGGFALVSLAVILTRSHPWCVKKKLKLGALIISLSGAMTGCLFEPTCYEPAPVNEFEIDRQTFRGDTLQIVLPDSNRLSGRIYGAESPKYSFLVKDETDSTIQLDSLVPQDGKFDSSSEAFQIDINPSTPAGIYTLKLYPVQPDSIPDRETYHREFTLEVIRNSE